MEGTQNDRNIQLGGRMKKFILEKKFLEIFPDSEIGILVCNGINNNPESEDKFAPWLRACEKESSKFYTEAEWLDNPVIRIWREAFYKFKTKKGARCSIEALLKRVSNGNEIGCINPLVDIYNGISLKYGMPIGGENIDKFEGDISLTVASGGEYFITYGSDKDEPALEGEVIYKDNGGAICRCWNWRESVRTMLTENVTNAFMIIEQVDSSRHAELEAALNELKKMIEDNLGGTVKKYISNKDNTEIEIA